MEDVHKYKHTRQGLGSLGMRPVRSQLLTGQAPEGKSPTYTHSCQIGYICELPCHTHSCAHQRCNWSYIHSLATSSIEEQETVPAVLVVVFARRLATSLHFTSSTHHSLPRALLLSGLSLQYALAVQGLPLDPVHLGGVFSTHHVSTY